MRPVALLLSIVSLVLLQTAVVPKLAPTAVRPDLVLLAMVAWGLRTNAVTAARGGIVAALLLDSFSGAPLGTSLVGLTAVLLLLRLGEVGGIKGDLLVALGAALVGTVVFDVVSLLVLEAFGRAIDWRATIGNAILPAAVVNALFMPIIYGAAACLQDRLGQEVGTAADRSREA